MKTLQFWLPVISIAVLVLCSVLFDGISIYDIPEPLGWLSNPSEAVIGAGCF